MLIALAPVVCAATDTLDCSGEVYSVQFHVGSEGIVDFTLFAAEGAVATGARKDLNVVRFEWPESEHDFAKNFVTVRTEKEFHEPFELEANGETGQIAVESVLAPVICDWRR